LALLVPVVVAWGAVALPGPAAASPGIGTRSARSSGQCGTWSVDPSPSPNQVSVLLGSAAVSATDAWTVGWSAASTRPLATLVEHWDGSSWTVTPTQNPGRDINVLTALAAAASDDAWAVG